MKNIKHLLYYTFIAFSIFCVSCDAEDGMDGTDGIDGTVGPAGEDGNANVIASEWIPEQFEISTTGLVSFDITNPIFTQELVDSSAILVYGRLNINAIVPIPILFTNRYYSYGIIPDFNSLRILGETIDETEFTFEDFEAFRYVIIPPNGSGRSSVSIEIIKTQLEEKGIDINTYNEVAAYYRLD